MFSKITTAVVAGLVGLAGGARLGAQSANLGVTVTDSPDPVNFGANVTYTLQVNNQGPNAASGVRVTNTLPAGFTFASANINFGTSIVTQKVAVVNYTNTVWKYDQSGADLGTTWKDTGFNDSAWPSGRGPLGYETGAVPVPITTTLALTNTGTGVRPITYYFRTAFVYTNTTTNAAMTLRYGIDDGMVVYLNGQEIFRDTNMPTGTITYTTQATRAHTENQRITNEVNLLNLVSGTNLLAVEVHQNGTTSSDVYFALDADIQTVTGGAGAGYTVAGQNVIFTLGDLPASSSATLTVVARADQYGAGTNSAIIVSSTPDPVPANNAAQAVTSVNPPLPADIALAVSDAPDPVQTGTPLTYTIYVTNRGPSWATNVAVTNLLPAGMTLVSATFNNAGMVTQVLSFVSMSNVWKYNQGGTDLGTEWRTTGYDDTAWLSGGALLANEDNTAITPYTNTVLSLNDGGGTRILTYYFRTAFIYNGSSTSITGLLSALIDDGAVFYLNGQEIWRTANMGTGTIVYTNLASASATENALITTNLVLTNLVIGTNVLAVEVHQNNNTSSDVVFGAGLAQTQIGRGLTTVNGNEVVFRLGTLPPNIVTRVDMVVMPTLPGTIFNNFEAGSAIPDSNLDNNSVTVSTLVSSEPVVADLAVTMTDAPDPAFQGANLTYNIAVRNLGPAAAPNARLTNYLSPTLTLVSASPGCTLTNNLVICNLGTMAVSAQSNLTVVVRPTVVGLVTNLAVAMSDLPDTTPTNNAVLALTTVLTSLRADLQVSSLSRPSPATAGELFTNVVTVFNAGPSNAPAVSLTNRFSGPYTLSGVRILGAGTFTNLGAGVVVCSLGQLASGGSVSVEYELRALAVGTITNIAGAASSILDPDLSNNQVTATTRVNPPPVVDLTVGVAASVDTIFAGDPVTYTIAVTNNGQLTGTGIQLTNLPPAGMTLIGLTNSQGACTNLGGMVVCNLGTLAGGAVATVSYQIIAPNSGTLTNIAGALPAQPDFNLADNIAFHLGVVVPSTAADLELTVTPAETNLFASMEVNYRLLLVNKGPLNATGIMITNVLPAGVRYLRANTTQGSILSVASNVVVISAGNLARGASLQAGIIGRVEQHGSLTNIAAVAGQQPDPTPNVVQTVLNARPGADVAVLVTESSDPVSAASVLTYTITAVNYGPSVASNALVYCYLPAGAKLQGLFASAGTYTTNNETVMWNLGNLAAGTNATLEIDLLTGDIGMAVASVGIVANEYDPVTTNNNVAVTTTVLSTTGGEGIVVTPSTNANALAAALSASGATGIKVNSVNLRAQRRAGGEGGVATSSGLYSIASTNAYGLSLPGVILSTGAVEDYGSGPNSSAGLTTAYGRRAAADQELLLDPITGQGGNNYAHYDVTQLDINFDMLPGYDHVTFKVVFGSEEFDEFVGSEFIDGFGIYLNGTNIAFASGQPVNIDHPDMTEVVETELDGVILLGGTNVIMTFSAPIEPGSTGHKLTFILADTSDAQLDTTVFISSLEGIQGANADLGLRVTANPEPVAVGGLLVYSLTVTNQGPDTATNTILTATLPAVFTNLAATVSTGTYGVTNGVITWNVGNLARRAGASATITGRPTFDARFVSAFAVASALTDLKPGDNSTNLISTAVDSGSFYNPAEMAIRDGAAALPYPSTLFVSGMTGVVDTVAVTLLDFTHSFPADVNVLLMAPDGRTTVLMTGVGAGYDVATISLRFEDAGSQDLPGNAPLQTGVFRPTSLASNVYFPGLSGVAPQEFGRQLSNLRRVDPNGIWRLFVYDKQGGDMGALAGGWNLKLTTVPEMTVRVVGNNIVVSWHDLAGYTLQGATQLTANTVWTAVPGTPVVAGGMRTMTVPMSSGYKYFRLRK